MKTKNRIVLIDFWAEWCNPCKIMSPIIDEIKDELGDKIGIYKINVEDEENSTIVSKYKILSLPTLLLVDDGVVIEQFTGIQTKKKLIEIINTLCKTKEKK